ncbi:hypothetical protein RJ640_003624 [Escallonia rubra]|uniref:Uncharacterized protein n=1 Tax=Escallonia rubra TaxID=112253 RepID=A0AA88QIA1_9ASTE|nr:hypothetical protein RJ640_003624 [Escallonia rubra]
MSATVVSEAMVMMAAESQPKPNGDFEFVKCNCCRLTEECTTAYIDNILKRFNGRWICGLCGEAVKDEIMRCERLVSAEEAMNQHMSLCYKFNSAGPHQIFGRAFDIRDEADPVTECKLVKIDAKQPHQNCSVEALDWAGLTAVSQACRWLIRRLIAV